MNLILYKSSCDAFPHQKYVPDSEVEEIIRKCSHWENDDDLGAVLGILLKVNLIDFIEESFIAVRSAATSQNDMLRGTAVLLLSKIDRMRSKSRDEDMHRFTSLDQLINTYSRDSAVVVESNFKILFTGK